MTVKTVRPRILPILVGTQQQELWQRVLRDSGLHEALARRLVDVRETALVAKDGLSHEQLRSLRDQNGSQCLLLLLLDLDANQSEKGNLRSHIASVTWIMRGESPFGHDVVVVLPSAAQATQFKSQYPSDGGVWGVFSAEDPGKLQAHLKHWLGAGAVAAEPGWGSESATATPQRTAEKTSAMKVPNSPSFQSSPASSNRPIGDDSAAGDRASSRGPAQKRATVKARSTASAKHSPESSSPSRSDDDLEGAEDAGDKMGQFEDFPEDEFTGFAWMILQSTRRLGEGRPRPDTASVRRLLTSILLSGLGEMNRPRSGKDRPWLHTGTWLLSLIDREPRAIRDRLANQYPVVLHHEGSLTSILGSERGVADAMTARLRETLDLARSLARLSQPFDGATDSPRARVGARHLLGAAVRHAETDTNVARFLRDFGLEVRLVRDSMIASLRSWDVPDDPDVWRSLLDPVSDVAADRTVPTYASDSASGPDWIGITREVEAMASLVSAWSVEPPLSIGLFGEWGSGKSFFMQKLKERVKQISQEARKSGNGQKEFGYYKNIVQVEFNAWHYVEGNLWASLVEHIFANLKLEAANGEDVDSEENIGKRLQRLLGEVREKTAEARKLDDETKALTEAATRKKDEAEKKAKALEAEAQAAKKLAEDADRERAEAQRLAEKAQREAEDKSEERRKIELKDILEEVAGSKELKEDVRQGLEKLGITRDRLQTVEDLRGAMRDATDAGTMIAQGIKILRDDGQPWRLLLLVLIVPALIAGTALFVGWLGGQQDSAWLQSVIGVVSAVAAVPTFLVGAWKKYGPRLKPVLKTIEDLKRKRADLEARVEEARRLRSENAARLDQQAESKKAEADAHRQRANEKMLQAQAERRAAAAKQTEADAMGERADQARLAAAKLAQDADLLRPERRIATFIQDRAAAKDYRQHLGVPAIIRRDFQKLEAMFRTQRDVEDNGKDGLDILSGEPLNGRNDPSVVNRIILYIDDLDRCPPKKVVEVLQAIHLLLAFPLFVVVVAVDARWMKRSLRDQFTLMLSGNDGKGNGSPERSPEKEPHLGSTATPDDYLEKIFQVPFWIRPLGPAASQNLVRELTRNDLSTPAADARGLETSTTETPNRSDSPAPETPAPGLESGAEKGGTGNAQSAKQGDARSSGVGEHAPSSLNLSWSPVEPRPRTLQLSEEERNYMISLATVIGRSPRSIKRFVNCYRLAKMTLEPADLARHSRDGTFRTTMLLLGVVSGMPEIAPELLTNLRSTDRKKSPAAWAKEATAKLGLEERGKWGELLPIIRNLGSLGIQTIAPLAAAADHVDRFSFNPVRSTPTG